MGLLIRTLFIWLLVLAVPVQGAAAATMAFCGPGHHGGVSTGQTLETPVASHLHADSAAASEHQHAQAVALSDDDTAAATDSEASAAFGHASGHKCSACAACCSLGAILNSVLAVPAPVFGPTVFSTVVPSVDAFAAEGPDRPPRHVLA